MSSESESVNPQIRVFEVDRQGRRQKDRLAVEEPLEIRVAHYRGQERREDSLSLTMRTPGHDFELAVGFLRGEGLLDDRSALENVTPPKQAPGCNQVQVSFSKGVGFDFEKVKRHFYATSSCGVCGKASIDALQILEGPRCQSGRPQVKAAVIRRLPDRLSAKQSAFRQTGGLHAAAIFTAEGELECLREDVGRHNAVDKAIGRLLLDGRLPLSDSLLMVSGRTSFEILQKALAAGIPVVAAVSAPSSLAVETAREFGMTLLGFVRDGRFNVYSDNGRMVE